MSLADFDRPLNKRGKRDAPEMGRRLASRGLCPDSIVSSPAKRAIKTAQAIARVIGFPEDKIQADERIYHASVAELINVIRGMEDGNEHAFVFGHNPGFTDLAVQLTLQSIDNIPTCGVFDMAFDLPSWTEVWEGTGRFLSFDYPKNLGEPITP